MNNRIRVALVFGGRSAEHEVSLCSARNIAIALSQCQFELLLVGISRSGHWYLSQQQEKLTQSKDVRALRVEELGSKVHLVLRDKQGEFISEDGKHSWGVDVVFPIVHGTFGEDGTLQGFLKFMNLPFVGASVLGSALAMDKDVMKRLFREAGLPIADFMVVHRHDPLPRYAAIVNHLGSPFFVKPANMGSSIGVRKVSSESQFQQYVEEAFRFDTKIIFERYIAGRELECSVMGNEDLSVSLPGELRPQHDFYSYEAKYLDENGALFDIPAKIAPATVLEVQELAGQAYKVLCLAGMARVDFFLENGTEKVYLNEANTLPGFTEISMYPKMWEQSGVSNKALVEKLIALALAKHKMDQSLSVDYRD